jgi:hypothetical protein
LPIILIVFVIVVVAGSFFFLQLVMTTFIFNLWEWFSPFNFIFFFSLRVQCMKCTEDCCCILRWLSTRIHFFFNDHKMSLLYIACKWSWIGDLLFTERIQIFGIVKLDLSKFARFFICRYITFEYQFSVFKEHKKKICLNCFCQFYSWSILNIKITLENW